MHSEQKVKIILHGYLKDLYSETIELVAHSAAEAINGMCKFTKAFNVGLKEDKHLIQVLGFNSEEELRNPLSPDVKELHLVPAFLGGKGGGFIKIVIGAVLIAAAFYLGPTGAPLMGAKLTSAIASIGISLALGGILELISPAPKIDQTGNTQSDPEASKYLGASQNTVKIGTRIPLVYGRHRMHGHYLTFNVDAKDVAL